jgi:hypothetical protein
MPQAMWKPRWRYIAAISKAASTPKFNQIPQHWLAHGLRARSRSTSGCQPLAIAILSTGSPAPG